jgi:hypothetical protein
MLAVACGPSLQQCSEGAREVLLVLESDPGKLRRSDAIV